MKAETGMTNTQAAVILVRENSGFLEGLSLEEIDAIVAMAPSGCSRECRDNQRE